MKYGAAGVECRSDQKGKESERKREKVREIDIYRERKKKKAREK